MDLESHNNIWNFRALLAHDSGLFHLPGIPRWGWTFLERTWILSGIQFTRHCIVFVVVETTRFVGSNVNMILTQQTCSQRWSRAAGGKRRALALYFGVRICHVFLISKYRVESHLGLCTTSVLANRIPPRIAKSDKFCGQTRILIGSRLPTAAFLLHVPKLLLLMST